MKDLGSHIQMFQGKKKEERGLCHPCIKVHVTPRHLVKRLFVNHWHLNEEDITALKSCSITLKNQRHPNPGPPKKGTSKLND